MFAPIANDIVTDLTAGTPVGARGSKRSRGNAPSSSTGRSPTRDKRERAARRDAVGSGANGAEEGQYVEGSEEHIAAEIARAQEAALANAMTSAANSTVTPPLAATASLGVTAGTNATAPISPPAVVAPAAVTNPGASGTNTPPAGIGTPSTNAPVHIAVPAAPSAPNVAFRLVSPCMLQLLASSNRHAPDRDLFIPIIDVLYDSGWVYK